MFKELRPLVRLAGPVVMAEIGWMSMGIVDTLMVGPLGPAAIGATGMSSAVFTALAIFGMGLMLGLDALVSQAFGARRIEECVRWLHHGVVLACLVAPIVMALTWVAFATVDWWGLHPDIRVLVASYLRVISLGAFPLLLYSAMRRYLQGRHIVRPVMAALISANLVNAAANWVLIYGRLGMPALGVEGSAWATSIARLYMALFLLVTIVWVHRHDPEHPRISFVIDVARLKRLVAIGFPAASQITLEVGVFAAATMLAGRLDPIASASNQIALNVVSTAFMVPLGLASAAAVRVGHAIGAGHPQRAVQTGWTALALGAAVMVAIAVVLFAWPEPLLRSFTSDVRVIDIGVRLLAIAAAFQLFDGTQAVATGVLRGLGETRMPMIVNVIGHWVFGLPIGYALCFAFGWGVIGLWVGLSIGLVIAGMALTVEWSRRTRQILATTSSPVPVLRR